MNMCRQLPFVLVAVVICGCANLVGHDTDDDGKLRAPQAAALAAEIANEKCADLYQERPFQADDYVPTFTDGRWRWGRMDPIGHYGLSAEVYFDPDGSDPDVAVYFSSDNTPPNLPESPAVRR